MSYGWTADDEERDMERQNYAQNSPDDGRGKQAVEDYKARQAAQQRSGLDGPYWTTQAQGPLASSQSYRQGGKRRKTRGRKSRGRKSKKRGTRKPKKTMRRKGKRRNNRTKKR